jgi:glycosyltransferase involved in cell wall biosynthesis
MQMDVFQKAKLLKLLGLKNEFDIIHFMLTPNKINAFCFKTFLKSKKAKTVQTVATLREDLYSDEDFKKIFFTDAIITYSDYAKSKLLSLGFQNVTRIYPGIDIENFKYTPKHLATMAMFGINESDFVVTYPGEYTRLGATDMLMEFIPNLVSQIPNLKFVFACRIKNARDAQKKDDVVLKLQKAGLLDKIVFTDTFSDMPKIYNLSDIVIFPVNDMAGKFDVPLAVVEAMACEKPVIISKIPVLEEFAKGGNSVKIEKGNLKQLEAAILDLRDNLEKRSLLGRNARKYVEEKFDIKNVAKQYETVYNQI